MFIGQFAWDKEQSYLESSKPENIKNVMPGTLGLELKMQNTFSYLSEQQFSPLKASSKYIEMKDEVGGFSNGCLLFHLSLLSLLENWENAVGRRDAAYIASQFPFCWWGKGPSIHHGWLECQGWDSPGYALVGRCEDNGALLTKLRWGEYSQGCSISGQSAPRIYSLSQGPTSGCFKANPQDPLSDLCPGMGFHCLHLSLVYTVSPLP